AAVAGRVGILALRAVEEESQRRHRPRGRLGPLHEAALRGDGVARERQAHRRDRGGRADVRAVPPEARRRVRLLGEVAERPLLEPVQVLLGEGRGLHWTAAAALWTASASVGWMWTASRRTV